MSRPEIGALGLRLAVEAPLADAAGAIAFATRFSVWGAMARQADHVAIRLRARDDLAPGWRLRCGAALFEIQSLEFDATRSGLMTCLCRELSP